MNGKKKTGSGFWIYLILIVGLAAAYFWYSKNAVAEDIGYTNETLDKDLEKGNIVSIDIVQNREVPTGTIYVKFTNGTEKKFYSPSASDTETICGKYTNVNVKVYDVKRAGFFEKALPYIFASVIIALLMIMLMGQISAGKANSKMNDFGKSRARKINETNLTFDDVAGLDEEKEDLSEIVDFLKDPKKYKDLGARIPKGVILVGPPGTGKTLIAKAIAGEAGVPFFSISGSDFVEMFVGVGASRVRDLFADAKKNSPCIIFIDEIDAVARRRGTGLGGGHDEREQTLNQMLVEMDGFNENSGIIVLAATNRVDILDPAILRPGRFDRKIAIGRPDVKGREGILKVHTKNKPLSDDVNIHEIARTTAGFSGADLENLMNEAAIGAAKDNRAFISKKDIDKSFIKVGIGTEKKSRLVPEKERRITAYHESGHAILFHLLSEVGPVYTVSIIPTGIGAAGYTMPLPENDNVFNTKKKMLQDIQVSLGGRIAEEIIFGDITTGASQDIKTATKTARDMVVKYGMSEKLGLINYENGDDEEVFLGRDLGHARAYGENVAADIDAEVKRIIDECYNEARKIIEEHIDVLHNSANLLLEKERIDRKEFESLFNSDKAMV